jgi:hypothetical protein
MAGGIIDAGQSLRNQALDGFSRISTSETNRANTNRALDSKDKGLMGQATGTAAGMALNYGVGQLTSAAANVATASEFGGVAGEVFPGAGLAGEAVPAATGPLGGAISGATTGMATGGISGAVGGGVGGALGGAVTAPVSLAGTGLSALGSGLSSLGATTVGGGLSAAGSALTGAASSVTGAAASAGSYVIGGIASALASWY